MKSFLNRKKTDESVVSANDDALSALSRPASPSLKKSGTSRWKKSKKQPEPMPQRLNLAAVLPPSDDFRTSLIMPNLSARFSMLREQDDPNSKLGKASDDSVLQPRRKSRMMDFGFGAGGLADIAEVQSIKSSKPRAPFANVRQDSFASELDGYGSDTDSTFKDGMMSRARPGEGNVLFGGRQKVYMIPSSGANSTKTLGKAVYEDDIGKSAFQKHKQREREQAAARMAENPGAFDFGLDQTDAGDDDEPRISTANDSARDLSHSSSLSSNEKKRSTTSSTAHSEARSSTAATSVASQPANAVHSASNTATPTPPPPAAPQLERANTKTRRLYEQGLDQHMYEQQASAMTRLNSIQRQRTLNNGNKSPPFLHTARSMGNLNDRMPSNVYALRAQSPPPLVQPPPLTTFGSFMSSGSGPVSPVTSVPTSPLSPSFSDYGDTSVLNHALEPADRGKATAMGAFNKPKQQFDEKQYLERQMQLQRSASTAAKPSMPQRIGRFEQPRERDRSDSAPAMPPRSRSNSRTNETTSMAFNVFQNAARQNASRNATPQNEKANMSDTHRTFFGNISASESDDEDESIRSGNAFAQQEFGHGPQYSKWQPSVLPSVSEHPALRSQQPEPPLVEEDEEEEEPQAGVEHTIQSNELTAAAESLDVPSPDVSLIDEPKSGPPLEQELDSPTLGPATDRINGMMHHLRQKSNQSSIYPQDDIGLDEVPDLPTMPQESRNFDFINRPLRSTYGSESRVGSTYTNSNSNPWDLDETDNEFYFGSENRDSHTVSPIEGPKGRAPFTSSRAPSRSAMRQSDISEEPEVPAWQNELRRQHTRDPSTATQQERAAFDNELAARRAAIQDNIKSIVESERGVSPAPSAGGAFKAFNMLRTKSSRDSFDTRRDAPPKAMKMLGMSAQGSPSAGINTNASSTYERNGYSLDVNRSRNNSASASRSPILPVGTRALHSELDSKKDWDPARPRGDSESSRNDRGQAAGRSSASTEADRHRSRSNSETTSGRSCSRTGPYRDDLEKAMMEGRGSSAAGFPELSPMAHKEITPQPSMDTMTSPYDGQSRARATSRVGMTGYFDAKNLQPLQTQQGRLGAASPNLYTPAGSSTRGSPATSTFITQTSTPPLSGTSTPAFSPAPLTQLPANVPPPPHGRPGGPLRKKTISKFEISEPKLISATSNIDTVDLPAGASLRNGIESPPPPVPPINPRRRATRKLFGGLSRNDSAGEDGMQPSSGRSKTPDPWGSRGMTTEPDYSFESGGGSGSNNNNNNPRRILSPTPGPVRGYDSSPALNQYGMYTATASGPGGSIGSPARITRANTAQAVGMDGGMF